MSRSSSARCARQKSVKAAVDVSRRRRLGGRRAAHLGHRVVERGERVVGAREEQVVHGRQQQEGPPLGERRAVEEREHDVVVGHAAADGRVGGAAVALGHGGEAPEVVGQGLFDEHAAVRSWPGAAG